MVLKLLMGLFLTLKTLIKYWKNSLVSIVEMRKSWVINKTSIPLLIIIILIWTAYGQNILMINMINANRYMNKRLKLDKTL